MSNRPNARTTDAEVEKRVNEVAEKLARGYTRYKIVQEGVQEWGISARSVDTYIQKAKLIWAPEIEEERAVIRAKQLAQYELLIEEAWKKDDHRFVLQLLQERGRFFDLYDFERNHKLESAGSIDVNALNEEELDAALSRRGVR